MILYLHLQLNISNYEICKNYCVHSVKANAFILCFSLSLLYNLFPFLFHFCISRCNYRLFVAISVLVIVIVIIQFTLSTLLLQLFPFLFQHVFSESIDGSTNILNKRIFSFVWTCVIRFFFLFIIFIIIIVFFFFFFLSFHFLWNCFRKH